MRNKYVGVFNVIILNSGLIVTGAIYQETQSSNYKSNDNETFLGAICQAKKTSNYKSNDNEIFHFLFLRVELHTIKFQSAEPFYMNNAIFELFASKKLHQLAWKNEKKKNGISCKLARIE